MSDTPETVMAERCFGCAFRPGTEANLNPLTQTTARLCIIAREPFFCHSDRAQRADGQGPAHLCRGFVDALEVEMEKERPAWHRNAALAILATMDDLRGRHDAGEAFSEDAFTGDLLRNVATFAPSEAS